MDPEYEAIVLFTSTIKGVQPKWMSIDRRIPPSTILFTNIVSTIVNYTDTDLLQHELPLVQFTFRIRVRCQYRSAYTVMSRRRQAIGYIQ